MRDISEKVSYLQGLTEGVNLTDGSPQVKLSLVYWMCWMKWRT